MANVEKSYLLLDDQTNLGSFNSNEPKYDGQRTYYGLAKDIPIFIQNCTYVLAGSLAICVDTGDSYMFEESDKTWYKM